MPLPASRKDQKAQSTLLTNLPSWASPSTKALAAQLKATKDVGKVKRLHDQAEALKTYAKRAGESFETQNHYAEVKIRAERRCGEILAQDIKRGGDRKTESWFTLPTLKSLGVSKYQSHRWQIIAGLPEEDFESHIAQAKKHKRELTSEAIYLISNRLRRKRRSEFRVIQNETAPRAQKRIIAVTGNFMDYIDKYENKADAVITDPPYGEKYLGLYEDLAKFAAIVLRPGGSLLTMAGAIYLPQIFESMCRHIRYHWTISSYMAARWGQVHPRKVLVSWKPILWFVKGKYEGDYVIDVLKSGPIEKEHHAWQQSESDFEALIKKFTRPGELIIDPFFGSGTLGATAIRTGRKFIGIEINPDTMNIAVERIGRCIDNSIRK